MAVAQTTYTERHQAWYAGQILDPQTCDVRSLQWTGTVAGTFGRACQRGSADLTAMANVATTRTLAGILIRDRTLRPSQDDTYVAGDVASVLIQGTVAVTVKAAVKPGDLVCVDPADGQFTTGNPGVASFVITAAGSGYTSNPTITVQVGEGYANVTPGAVSRSSNTLSGVGAPTSGNAGSGFLREPQVAVTGGAGSGAVVETRLTLIPVIGARYQSTAAANGLAAVHLAGLVAV